MLLVLAVAVAVATGSGAAAAAALGTAILVASFVTGTLLGFLFSVPRVLARETPVGQAVAGEVRRMLGTNTNLERISDWLTTLLVGAGLTQLGELGPGLASFAEFVRGAVAPMGPSAAMLPGLAPVILVAGSVLGFLTMYLYTRIEIAPVLSFVEAGMVLPPAAAEVVTSVADDIAKEVVSTTRAGGAVPAPVVTPGAVTWDQALNVMFDSLYRPEGFKRVIGMVDDLRKTQLAERADFWFYAAAAYGQAMAERRANADDRGAAMMRARALEAARKAVAINPVYRSRLRGIANPNGPDDDLAGLADDPDFFAITG